MSMKTRVKRWGLGAAVVGLLLGLSAPPTRSDDDGGDGGDWPMFGHDPRGTRFNAAERRLGPANVAGLKVLWRFPTPAIVAGTPAVVGGTAFAGDAAGNVYALKADSGQVRWQTHIDNARFTASAVVTRGRVVLGSQTTGVIYGLDQGNGRVVWQIKPNTFGRPAIWGSGTRVGDFVAIGVASNDEGPPPPFLSRGSLVLLDPKDGRVVWQTFTITDAEAARGSTGASIWTTPAYDEETDTIYVGTGNNFTEPATGTSDAIIAFDADTGAIRWVNQRFADDTWTPRFPTGPDFDFGDSPQLYRLPDGRKVVGDGQKSGAYHVLDAATGAVVHAQQFIPGSTLGGLYTDSAVAEGVVFAPGNDRTVSPPRCALIAMTGDGTTELWRFVTTGLEANGVAVANRVVYFKPSSDPNLYAFDTAGHRLAAVPVGGSNSGVAIAHGRLFLGLGDVFSNGFNFLAPGGIVALGLGDRGGDND
jgi:outer membrane protein assembly factor BamB